jgi:hypothetical protein
MGHVLPIVLSGHGQAPLEKKGFFGGSSIETSFAGGPIRQLFPILDAVRFSSPNENSLARFTLSRP